jgi:hypothetical protein
MNKEDIILMADASGISFYGMGKDRDKFLHYLEAFANLVAAHKAKVITAEAYRCGYKDGMEAAAVICENVDKSTHPADLANAIRARGNT